MAQKNKQNKKDEKKRTNEYKAANQWFPYPVGKNGVYKIRASITTQERLQASGIQVTIVDLDIGYVIAEALTNQHGIASIEIPVFMEPKKEIEVMADGTQLQPVRMTLRGPKQRRPELPDNLKGGFMNPLKALVAFWRGLTTKRR